MKIEKLANSNLADVYNCLTGSEENLAVETSESLRYLKRLLKRGWLAYAAYDDSGNACGMAMLTPSTDPLSPVTGSGIYHLQCMNVARERKGRGVGASLMERVEEDVRALGGTGISVLCFGDYWMPKSFFSHVGFEETERLSDHSLFVKKLSGSARACHADRPYRGDLPERGIQVDIQHWIACPFILSNYRRVEAMVRKMVPGVVVRERIISSREDVEEWGGSGVFVNGESVSAGPITEEAIRKVIQRARRD
jgi:GNAT superfamily N-acetyltransferase